jgi:hypothetical protein
MNDAAGSHRAEGEQASTPTVGNKDKANDSRVDTKVAGKEESVNGRK